MKEIRLSYTEQLKSLLWKDKRNSIVEQRGNKCERCQSTTNLQVHHIKYLKDKLAWEYEDSLLECLCGSCHMKEHEVVKKPDEDSFGLKNSTMEQSSNILKLRTLLLVNLNDNIVNYIVSNCEVLKLTDRVIRFKVHKNYIKYLSSKFSYCVEVHSGYIDIVIKKAIKNYNLMDFSAKRNKNSR